jgi:pyridoxine 4-dehydrogenase
MSAAPTPGGTLRLGAREVARIGYGAMQLEKVGRADATALLRRAHELGVDHYDTASFYGHQTVDAHLRAAFDPWPEDVVVVSKVGARRVDAPVPLAAAQRPDELRAQVHLDLDALGLDQVHVVNLRRMDRQPGIVAQGDQVVPIEDQLAELVALRDEGLVGAIGLSHVDLDQLRTALPAGIVCVQNAYSLLDRADEELLGVCAENGVAWVPFFPLGSAFERIPSPTDDPTVQAVATELDVDPAAVALAWLLAHDEHVGLIPGTRSIEHLEANVAVGDVRLSREQRDRLDGVRP